MAGNQAVFDAALRRAQGYAFENQWDKAIKEYQRALAEFPNEVEARTNYAQALYRQGQLPGAFDEYTGLLKARPNDPFILGRLAEIAETLGRRSDARAGRRARARDPVPCPVAMARRLRRRPGIRSHARVADPRAGRHGIHHHSSIANNAVRYLERRGNVYQRKVPYLPVADFFEVELRAGPCCRDANRGQEIARPQRGHPRTSGSLR